MTARRAFLTSTAMAATFGAVGVASQAAMAAHADAELLAAIADFERIEREVDALDVDDWNAIEPLLTEQDALLERFTMLPAATAEGVRAKARIVLYSGAGSIDPSRCKTYDDKLIASLLRDILIWEQT